MTSANISNVINDDLFNDLCNRAVEEIVELLVSNIVRLCNTPSYCIVLNKSNKETLCLLVASVSLILFYIAPRASRINYQHYPATTRYSTKCYYNRRSAFFTNNWLKIINEPTIYWPRFVTYNIHCRFLFDITIKHKLLFYRTMEFTYSVNILQVYWNTRLINEIVRVERIRTFTYAYPLITVNCC